MDPRQLNLGLAIAMVFLALWWNLQWQRFMQFWVNPPYRGSTMVLFRLFFAAALIGAAWNLMQRSVGYGLERADYVSGAEVGAAIIVVIWAMVHTMEWMNQKKGR